MLRSERPDRIHGVTKPGGGPSELLRISAARTPQRTALVTPRAQLTWAQLDVSATSAALALIERGLEPGARVALQLGSDLDFVALYLGALRAGLVAVPINPSYTGPEVRHILDDSGVSLHLDAPTARALLADAPADGVDPHRDRDDEGVAALLYTSGTSGPGKGAMLSSRALRANLEQISAVEPALVTADDVLFVPLPLTHIFGLNAGLGMALRVGATLVLADRFDPATTLATMAAEKVSAVLGVPGQFRAWLAQPDVAQAFASVRFAMSGSTTLARGLVDGFAVLGVTVHDGYGLTEASPVVTITALSAPHRPGSVGHPLPGVEVELRDLDGEPLDDGDPGRVFVRGANLFSGYWPDGHGGPDPDGWFGTGDIALTDDDGSLRLVGRSSETVIVNGFNVYPAEVEGVLAGLAGVAEVAVVGVADPATGEAIRAYVVPMSGVTVDPDELVAAAAGSLARFKLPTRIELVAALPRTVTGKIMKWQLDRDADDGSR